MSTTSPDSASPELVLLIGNPKPRSRTRAVAERVAALIEDAAPDVIDLADITAITYGADPVAPTYADATALERVRAARVLVVATPSYKGTYSGLLKVFLDRLPHLGLDGVIALPVAVAASPAHAEATAADLGRLLRELGAAAGTGIAVVESQLENSDLDAVLERSVPGELRSHVSASRIG